MQPTGHSKQFLLRGTQGWWQSFLLNLFSVILNKLQSQNLFPDINGWWFTIYELGLPITIRDSPLHKQLNKYLTSTVLHFRRRSVRLSFQTEDPVPTSSSPATTSSAPTTSPRRWSRRRRSKFVKTFSRENASPKTEKGRHAKERLREVTTNTISLNAASFPLQPNLFILFWPIWSKSAKCIFFFFWVLAFFNN